MIFAYSCSNKVDCPAFDENDLKDIPYKVGDTLKFQDLQENIKMIIVKKIKQSDAYTYKCKDLNALCVCTNYAAVIVDYLSNGKTDTLLKYEQSNKSDMKYYKYKIEDFYFEFDFENELPYIDNFEHIFLIDSLEINNQILTEVLVIRNISDVSSNISKVYFNKKFGILKYQEKNGNVWIRIK